MDEHESRLRPVALPAVFRAALFAAVSAPAASTKDDEAALERLLFEPFNAAAEAAATEAQCRRLHMEAMAVSIAAVHLHAGPDGGPDAATREERAARAALVLDIAQRAVGAPPPPIPVGPSPPSYCCPYPCPYCTLTPSLPTRWERSQAPRPRGCARRRAATARAARRRAARARSRTGWTWTRTTGPRAAGQARVLRCCGAWRPCCRRATSARPRTASASQTCSQPSLVAPPPPSPSY